MTLHRHGCEARGAGTAKRACPGPPWEPSPEESVENLSVQSSVPQSLP